MDLSKVLYTYGKCSQSRRNQLQDWLDAAIISLANGQGKTLASSSANNVNVSFMSNSLTITEWVSALVKAIELLDNPQKLSRKAIGVFR